MLPVAGYFGPRQTNSPRYERALFTYLGPVRLGKKRWIGVTLDNRHYVDYGHASALNCGWSAVSNRLGKSNTRPSAGACLNDGSSIARLVRFGSRLSWQLINQRPHVVCSLHQIELGLQIQPELRIHSEPMP